MADPLHTIAATLREAFAGVTGLEAASIDPVVRPSDRADAQANGALALAKQVGRNPRELAEEVVATGALAVAAQDDFAGGLLRRWQNLFKKLIKGIQVAGADKGGKAMAAFLRALDAEQDGAAQIQVENHPFAV